MKELQKAKDRKMIIGFTSLVGDVGPHAGHLAMLMEAKTKCNFLVVGLLIDPRQDRPEKNQPIQSVLERFIQLSAVSWVDMVIPLQNEKDLEDAIKLIQPDIRIVGEEYKGTKHTGWNLCKHYYNNRKHSFSSTELRNRIKQ